MKEFRITYTHDDLQEGFTSTAFKWAHDEKKAIRLLLASNPERSGKCRFKRGGTGKIINIEQINKT